MSKHTPGPWKATFERYDDREMPITVGFIYDTTDGCRQLFRAQSYNCEGTQYQPCEEMRANVELIARAPDMESALRAVMDTPHFQDMPDNVQAEVLLALGEKTSHTSADFDTGDKDPYHPNP